MQFYMKQLATELPILIHIISKHFQQSL